MRLISSASFCLSLILAVASRSIAASPAETINPLITETTVGVMSANLEEVDLAKMQNAAINTINKNADLSEGQRKEAIDNLKPSLAIADTWLNGMKTAGAKEVFLVFDVVQMRNGPIIVVTKSATANNKQIYSLIHSGKVDGPTGDITDAPTTQPRYGNEANNSAEVKGLIVHGPRAWINQVSKLTPTEHPNIAKAFEASGDGMVKIAIAPSETIRAMIEQAMPTLPAEIGGGPITDLSRGIDWISIGMGKNPGDPVHIIAQAPSPEAAAKVEEVTNNAIDLMAGNQQMNRMMKLGELLGMLRPMVDGSKLSITIDQDKVSGLVMPLMMRARQQAVSVQSMSNMRQLLLCIVMYSNENKGAFPDSLENVKSYLGDKKTQDETFAKLMINQQAPNMKPGYIYVKPDADKISKIKNASQRLIMYENYDKWPGKVAVGFVDGHVEMVVDKARFEKLLTDAGGKMPEEKN